LVVVAALLVQWLTGIGLLILAAIFAVGFNGEDSRPQLLRTFARVALLAAAHGCTTGLGMFRAGLKHLTRRSPVPLSTEPGAVDSSAGLQRKPPVSSGKNDNTRHIAAIFR
jgi:hypothetical protein